MSSAPIIGDLDPARSAQELARVAGLRAEARLEHAINDLFLPEESRLSDRVRATVDAVLARLVARVEAELRRHAAHILLERGAAEQARHLRAGRPVLERLRAAGLLRDPELMDELIARVKLELLAEALPSVANAHQPDLLFSLADTGGDPIANAARALLRAENRRRSSDKSGVASASDLPADLLHRLSWWIAAAVREQMLEPVSAPDHDRALTEATLRALSGHDEADRPEAIADRLAAAIDASTAELPTLLLQAIGDGRLVLFTALIARAAGVDAEQVRHLVIDTDTDLLVLILHAVGVDRGTIARIGVALAEADPRRNLDRLANAIDWAVSQDPAAARASLAPLALCRDFRAAIHALVKTQ